MLLETAEKSRYRKSPKFLSGGGGLVSTVQDYARFLQMLLNGGGFEGKQLLGKKTVELMLRDHLGDIPNNWMSDGLGFGLGASVVRNRGLYGALVSEGTVSWAGIYNTFYFLDPKEEMIGIIMMQREPFESFEFNRKFQNLCMQAIID